MNITRDTIVDLLPLYLSGEASPATQQLVREFLASDPSLAELARQQEAALQSVLPPAARIPDLETASFQRTRKRVVSQRWAFGLAWLFTALTLSTEVHLQDGHVVSAQLALANAPILLGLVATLATVCWLTYAELRRRS